MKKSRNAIYLSILALTSSWSAGYAEETKAPKNFVVIFADDFGFGDIGCYRELFQGGDDRTLSHQYTPNLDQLGRDGVRFLQAYTASWCAPARQNLLAGRWCMRADNIAKPWIGKQLRDRGYRTCFVGKSHGSNSTRKVVNRNPKTAEFDDGFFFPNGMRDFYLRPGEKFPSHIDFKSQDYIAKGGEYITDTFTDFGVDFIKRAAKDDKPFFMYMAYTAPHTPLDGKLADLQQMFPGEFDGLEEEDWRNFLYITDSFGGIKKKSPPIAGWSLADSPSYKRMKKMGSRRFAECNFAALVYRMDLSIGRLIKTLEEAGVKDDTMIVFTADNGSTQGSNYPLTGYKSSHFEGGIRVPMIFWSEALANSAASGRVVKELCPTTDVAPTMLGIAKNEAEPSFPFDGINLWPYLANNQPIPDDQIFCYVSDTSQLYKGLGIGPKRQPEIDILAKMVKDTGDNIFGQTGAMDRMFNAVYVKGKEKVVYWSSSDGATQGAVYKKLPEDGRSFEAPQVAFREELVSAGQFPECAAGKKLFQEFKAYACKQGPDELMHSAVFKRDDMSQEKRAREYLSATPVLK